MNYGLRLKEVRNQLGITQKQLKDILQCSQSQISEWETGHTRIGLDDIVRICEALNITTDYFLKREGSEYDFVIEHARHSNIKPEKLLNIVKALEDK